MNTRDTYAYSLSAALATRHFRSTTGSWRASPPSRLSALNWRLHANTSQYACKTIRLKHMMRMYTRILLTANREAYETCYSAKRHSVAAAWCKRRLLPSTKIAFNYSYENAKPQVNITVCGRLRRPCSHGAIARLYCCQV